jgi:hypothetical protein
MRPGAASPFHVPNHRAVRSGSVTLAHTSSMGARNVRLTTSSLPSAVWTSPALGDRPFRASDARLQDARKQALARADVLSGYTPSSWAESLGSSYATLRRELRGWATSGRRRAGIWTGARQRRRGRTRRATRKSREGPRPHPACHPERIGTARKAVAEVRETALDRDSSAPVGSNGSTLRSPLRASHVRGSP